jgi:glycosyltransferase involved in cell wall biosynthesis
MRGWRPFIDSIDPLKRLYTFELKSTDVHNTRSASLVLANSAYSREVLYRVYAIHARICYLGVDQTIFRPLNLERKNCVLSTGALRPDKGFDFIIRSLALIPAAQRPDLLIISNQTNPEELAYLQSMAGQNHVNVTFKELVSDEELVQAYNQALLTVYAPNLEPFGFVPLESMACGTPVVGVREAGVRESVVDGQTGFLTDRDPQEFARALQTLLEDQATHRRFGENSLSHVREHWGWDHTISTLEHSFRSVIQPGGSA